MKQTKIMLAVIATFLTTWCVMGLIGYLISDDTFKQSMSSGGTFFFMILFGWIPSIIVGADLDKSLE